MKSWILILTLFLVLVWTDGGYTQVDTAAARQPAAAPALLPHSLQKPLELPQLKDRLWMCGLALLLLGGLAVGINLMRKEADRRALQDDGESVT